MAEAVNCESWGFTMNEAMSCQLPVVTTNAAGAAYDLIIPNKTGKLAKENDSDSLAESINSLLDNALNTRQMGKNAREHLLKTCNYDQNLVAYLNAINYACKK